jgi:ATP-dependent DNA helicase RecG
MTSIDQLREWMLLPESHHLEFKEAKQAFESRLLCQYCVALANEGGGKVVLGVSDKMPRHIVGTNAWPDKHDAEKLLHDGLRQRVGVEELISPEGRVLIFHVPGRAQGVPWEYKGAYYMRAGSALVGMGQPELQRIFAEARGEDFSAQIHPEAKLTDLNPDAVRDFRMRWAKKTGQTKYESLSDEETLLRAELATRDGITHAALILFGSYEALTRLLPSAEIVFEYRASEAAGPASQRENLREGFFLEYERIWQLINLRNDRQSYRDGLFVYDIPTFDEDSVREALLNAVSHRDYRSGASIFIRQYARRLEVVSPGAFPDDITPETVREAQYPRNRRLAEVFGKCGLVERAGQGVDLMIERAIRLGKATPDYSGSNRREVRLTLPGTVEHPAFVRYLERLGNETVKGFSAEDFIVLDLILREEQPPESMKRRIQALETAGAIERIGRGKSSKLILSRSLHAEMGAKAAYTRAKGLDRNTNKALLLDHLKGNMDSGAPIGELMQVLPSQNRKTVARLLEELRDSGCIELKGKNRYARWHWAKPMSL